LQDPEAWVKVHILENQFEADQMCEVLDRESIPYWVKGYQDTAYNGIFVTTKGWGALWVPEKDEVRARELIAHTTQAFEHPEN